MNLPLNKIICGDSLVELRKLPDKSIDVVLMDPPYGVNIGKHSKAEYDTFKDTPEYVVPMVNNVLNECLRVSDLVVMTPGLKNMFKYPEPDHVGSFYYPAGVGVSNWGFTCWQPIYFYGKDPYLKNRLGSRPDSTSSGESAPKNGHPCPKPVGQWRWLLNRIAFKGQTVLDPFIGSGTTAVVAKELGINYIGIEVSPEYCEIANNRLKQEVLL
jgi:site-specific DNA-methyltransferase (adenine-specific)